VPKTRSQTPTPVARIGHEVEELPKAPLVGPDRRQLLDASTQAHLVVLGSRGRRAVRSMLLGSVSATVSAHAAYPLIVAAPADGPTQAGVVGADATPEPLLVNEFGYRLASLRNLPITVVHTSLDAAVVERAQSTVARVPQDSRSPQPDPPNRPSGVRPPKGRRADGRTGQHEFIRAPTRPHHRSRRAGVPRPSPRRQAPRAGRARRSGRSRRRRPRPPPGTPR